MRRVLVLAAAVAAAAGSGCASARHVHKSGDEGIVAITANTDAWPEYNRTNAMKLIEEHVGPNFEILEEREVVTGTVTNNTQQTKDEATFNSEVPFLPATKETTTTTTTATPIKEWQIHYRRASGGLTQFPGGGVPGGAAAPAGGVVPASHTGPAGWNEAAPRTGSVAPAAMTAGSPALPPPNLPNMTHFGGPPR